MNTLYVNQEKMYNVAFAEPYWNVWDKWMADDGILIFAQILGQFMMKTGGDYSDTSAKEYNSFRNQIC